MAQSGYRVLLWPVNYIAWTFSAYLKQLKWIGYRKEALKLLHWQSHSHGVILPCSKKTSLITWVKYTLAKSHSTKLPTGYSHRNSHTATFSFTFRILKMWVMLHQKQYGLLMGISALLVSSAWTIGRKSILKWKKKGSPRVCRMLKYSW